MSLHGSSSPVRLTIARMCREHHRSLFEGASHASRRSKEAPGINPGSLEPAALSGGDGAASLQQPTAASLVPPLIVAVHTLLGKNAEMVRRKPLSKIAQALAAAVRCPAWAARNDGSAHLVTTAPGVKLIGRPVLGSQRLHNAQVRPRGGPFVTLPRGRFRVRLSRYPAAFGPKASAAPISGLGVLALRTLERSECLRSAPRAGDPKLRPEPAFLSIWSPISPRLRVRFV